MPLNTLQLIFEARRLVAHSNREFALLTGASLRTVERYSHNGGISDISQTHKLIAAVHPKNPDLANQLAAAAGTTLEALGVVKPAPTIAPAQAASPPPPAVVVAPPPSPSIPEARPEHADLVLFAAANALDMSPRALRPAVAAAFAKAKELGVSVGSLADLLAREAGPQQGP
jgi:hypothetical protein